MAGGTGAVGDGVAGKGELNSSSDGARWMRRTKGSFVCAGLPSPSSGLFSPLPFASISTSTTVWTPGVLEVSGR